MTACAITDHGNLYGAVEFYNECKKGGIKPIIGYEAYLAPGARTEKKPRQGARPVHAPDAARQEQRRLQEPHQAVVDRVPRRLLLQPADRPRGARRSTARGSSASAGCLAGEFNQLHPRRETRRRPRSSRSGSPRSSRTTSTSRSRTTASTCRTSARRSRPTSPRSSACRSWPPRMPTTSAPRTPTAHDVLFCINTAQEARPAQEAVPRRADAEPVLRPQPGGHVPALPRVTRTRSRAARRSPTGSTSTSTSRSGTSRSSRRRTGRSPTSTCANCASRACASATATTPAEAVTKRLDHELGIIDEDGVRELLPDRLGLRPLRPRGGHPLHGPRLRVRRDRQLRAVPQPRRSARVRPAVRAVPRPEPQRGARHRHRLLPGPPRPGHRLREAEVRRRVGRPDRHVRHAGGEGGAEGRRPRARRAARARQPDVQARADEGSHRRRPGRGDGEPRTSSASTTRTRRSGRWSTSPASWKG